MIEIVFGYPGMGTLLHRALAARDYPLLQGILLLASVTVAKTVAAARAAGMDARYELIPTGDLLVADGVWLVSSARGAAPVTHVDGRPIEVRAELVERVARFAGFAA